MTTFSEAGDIATTLRNMSPVEEFQSSKQLIQFHQHPGLGKVLIIDGEVQHVEACSELYHEPLVHLPVSFTKAPRSCLIIGGGSLFAAHEVLKHRSFERLLLVDHDPEVLALMARHYLHARSVLADGRFEYRESDGIDFLSNCNDKFDLIINDCFDLSDLSNKEGRN